MGCLQSKNTAETKGEEEFAQKRVTVTQGVKELRAQYNINRNVLGSGSFGQVFKAIGEYFIDFPLFVRSDLASNTSPSFNHSFSSSLIIYR